MTGAHEYADDHPPEPLPNDADLDECAALIRLDRGFAYYFYEANPKSFLHTMWDIETEAAPRSLQECQLLLELAMSNNARGPECGFDIHVFDREAEEAVGYDHEALLSWATVVNDTKDALHGFATEWVAEQLEKRGRSDLVDRDGEFEWELGERLRALHHADVLVLQEVGKATWDEAFELLIQPQLMWKLTEDLEAIEAEYGHRRVLEEGTTIRRFHAEEHPKFEWITTFSVDARRYFVVTDKVTCLREPTASECLAMVRENIDQEFKRYRSRARY